MNNNYITMNFKDISMDEILKQIEQLKQEQFTENIYDIISEDEQITHKIPNDDNDVDNAKEKDNDDVLHNIAHDDEENDDSSDSDIKQKDMVSVKIYEADDSHDDDLLSHLINEDEESDDETKDSERNSDNEDEDLFDVDENNDEEEIDEKEEKQVNEMFAIV
ncbi:hypothetical protein, partial [Calditerrivibrio sp.]|uniref:hypothetical protein n=1 Tax=Calditerrivibrio sp. TaxID=2792612 RepID=UPI003D0C289A